MAIVVGAQTIPFPTCPPSCLPGNINNPVQVGPDRPLGGGYSGNWVVAQCQWGPCGYNTVTRLIWRDVISCSECASGGGGRYKANVCDQHQGVSMVFVGAAGYAVADNYLASRACNSGPLSQFYRLTTTTASFVFGADVKAQGLLGFIGPTAYFLTGGTCTAVQIDLQSVTTGVPCPASFDPKQTTDPLGNTWTKSNSPNGLMISGSFVSPTPTPTGPTATPSNTFTPTLTRTVTNTRTVTVSPTPSRTPTVTPIVQVVCYTVTPTNTNGPSPTPTPRHGTRVVPFRTPQ
jgi:hypothetical protein